MAELTSALNPPLSSGGEFDGNEILRDNSSNSSHSLEAALLKKLLHDELPDNDDGEFLFHKLRNNPPQRKSLTAINKARAFKYGSRAFGLKKWYKETFDTVEGLRTNDERRKFRFGLKSNIDFLIQLDILNLKTCLQDTSFTPQRNNAPHLSSLSDGSFLDTINRLNPSRCTKVCKIIDRISNNLNFTQSLAEYFATDDMLEPALMLISEVLRRGPDLHKNLHGGTFASNAMVYRQE